jgi:hypothetical protein
MLRLQKHNFSALKLDKIKSRKHVVFTRIGEKVFNKGYQRCWIDKNFR